MSIRRALFFVVALLVASDLPAQVKLPIAASDTAFYGIMKMLVRDSLWSRDQKAPQSYFATTNESLVNLRRAGVKVDSVAASRFVGCSTLPTTGSLAANAVLGNVLTATVSAGINDSTVAMHFTVGCKSLVAGEVKVSGHYCGWDVVREKSAWRVLRSRRCWLLQN